MRKYKHECIVSLRWWQKSVMPLLICLLSKLRSLMGPSKLRQPPGVCNTHCPEMLPMPGLVRRYLGIVLWLWLCSGQTLPQLYLLGRLFHGPLILLLSVRVTGGVKPLPQFSFSLSQSNWSLNHFSLSLSVQDFSAISLWLCFIRTEVFTCLDTVMLIYIITLHCSGIF